MNIYKIIKEHIRRSIKNYKIYLVSILGMSIAFIATFHIYHFVFKEISVDGFHTKKKEIYRVHDIDRNEFRTTSIPYPLGEIAKSNFPEVKDYVRIQSSNYKYYYINGNLQNGNYIYSEPSFFKVFDFKLLAGNLEKFSESTNGIIISEKLAKSVFKSGNVLGKNFSISSNKDSKKTIYEVVGVMEDIPQESTIQGDFIAPITNEISNMIPSRGPWFSLIGQLYLHIPNHKNPKEFSKKLAEILVNNKWPNSSEEYKNTYQLELQRFDNIYLNSSKLRFQSHKTGSIRYINILILVGLLCLIIAITNYVIMNLGINISRTKEYTLRRYLGASKKIIFKQILIESLFNSIICLIISLLSFPIISEFSNNILGSNYQLNIYNDQLFMSSFIGIVLFIGLITAIFQYAFSYGSMFSKKKSKNNFSEKFRLSEKFMIGFQLFLFLNLLIGIFFINKQVDFMQQKELGFNHQNVISIRGGNPSKQKQLKQKISELSYVIDIAEGDFIFKEKVTPMTITVLDSQLEMKTNTINGDSHYFNVYNLQLLYGKHPNTTTINTVRKKVSNRTFKNLDVLEVVVNEEFIKKSNLKNPLGKIIKLKSLKLSIVGVFKNIHNTPLHISAQPILFIPNYFSRGAGSFQILYSSNSEKELFSFLENYYVDLGIESSTISQRIKKFDYNTVYKNEIQLKHLLETFTVIVLFIFLLGMIAISLFITESKTKEIGIRKVNGASIKEILFMLNKDFIKWIVIAFVIACPISYYLMDSWLESFAYKTTLSWWVFALAGVLTFIVTLITVSLQTYRAATQNPVKSLRDE